MTAKSQKAASFLPRPIESDLPVPRADLYLQFTNQPPSPEMALALEMCQTQRLQSIHINRFASFTIFSAKMEDEGKLLPQGTGE